MSSSEIREHNPGDAVNAEALALRCSPGNVWCSGERHSYHEDHRVRRHLTKRITTLMHKSGSIEQD